MVDNYSQSVEVDVTHHAKRLQWTGIFLVLFSLGFVVTSIFYSWYFMIAFGVFFVAGIVCIHIYNQTAKEYIYEVSPTRLVIVKKDVVNKQSVVLSLLFKDVTSFGIMDDMYHDKVEGEDVICCNSKVDVIDYSKTFDILFCNKAYDMGVYQIVFMPEDTGISQKVLFAPDEYMVALINEHIKSAKAKTEEKQN